MSSGASGKRVSAAVVGALVASYESGGFDRRRPLVLSRLRQLRDGEQFASLPDDLQQRIREIVAASSAS